MTATERAAGTAGQQTTTIGEGRYARANGTDIYYVEAGQGEPLLLLPGGLVSNNPVWAGAPVAWVSHLATFARHFRVIAPDTRGCGRTVNPGGDAILYPQLADDVVALIGALGLERPLLCGFSDGATTATVVGLRHPGAARAIVNDAGYDLFNPDTASIAMARQFFGGSPDATRADPAHLERLAESSDAMRAFFAPLRADDDGAQGPGHWLRRIAESFGRITSSPGYTFEDFRAIAVPTLILVGDRDQICSPEEGIIAYRKLPQGELAIVPGTGHWISPLKVQLAIEFLGRHGTPQPVATAA
jgi:pimeloyl-ACP methyl ester carboxylesterase